MRIEGQAKLGYYPTPPITLSRLCRLIAPSEGIGARRLFDPCCGKGEALAALAQAAGPDTETFGVELSDTRAQAAEAVLGTVINTAYESAVVTPASLSLILLNPPYDGEGEVGQGKRMEESFLCDQDTTLLLIPGGVLVYLIPYGRINERIARHLGGWYSDLRCYRLPQEEYDIFHQIAVLGIRRSQYKAADGTMLKSVMAWQTGQRVTGWKEMEELIEGKRRNVRKPVLASLEELPEGGVRYVVPPSPLRGKNQQPFRFQYRAITPEDYLREADRCAAVLDASRVWLDLVPSITPPIIEPAMSPKKGHIAMQVSGGLLGTNLVRSKDGSLLLLKGSVSKISNVRTVETEEDPLEADEDADRARMDKVEVEESFQTRLALLTPDRYLLLTNPEEIAPVLEEFVGQLAEIVQKRNVPQYDLHPLPWEWSVFDPLSRGRALPGRVETGLTDFQRHLTIALGRLCLRKGSGFCNAEMGSGKTSVGIALAEYLAAALQRRTSSASPYPALVVGPGIVTGSENWPKEVVEVTPGAQARVITSGARPLPKPEKIGRFLLSLGLALEENACEGKGADAVLQFIRAAARKQKVALAQDLVCALRSSLRDAEQHPPVRRRGARHPNLLDGRIGGYLWLGMDLPRDTNSLDDLRGKYTVAQFVREYQSGDLPHRSFAVLSYETAKLGSGRVPAMPVRTMLLPREDLEGNRVLHRMRVCVCPHCGTPVAEDRKDGLVLTYVTPAQMEEFVGLRRRFCDNPVPRRVWNADKGIHEMLEKDDEGNVYTCGAPLFEVSALRRVSAAEYVRRKARRFFGLCLVDEVHKAKAKGTGVGASLTALSSATRWTVGLTGTLFGGYSTSIFWLMHRLSADVRRDFGFNDEQRWTERYGLLKRVFYTKSQRCAEDGAYSGTKFFETVSEKPGISPAIAGLALGYCTFSSLKDIGLPLPEYGEQIVRIPMSEEMQEQYVEADGSATRTGLFKWALDESMREDGTGKGAISVWLNTALNRPDAMFREEVVQFRRRISGRGRFAVRQVEDVLFLPPTMSGEMLPKERWLVDRCLAETRQGRKTLVYVRQTGTRDIQERLVSLLGGTGLKAEILRPSLSPASRAGWIKRRAERCDILLTNARLVEVGLNLTSFHTAVFFELEWSLYTLWQAMRRLYRPGAARNVQLYFPVYEGTLEDTALSLIGAKMCAAQVFYGDEIGGALSEESDTADLLNEIVRAAMGKLQVGRPEGIFSTGGSTQAESPMGSPVAVSPRMVTFAELAARRYELVRPVRSRKPAVLVLPGQIPLF